MARRTVSKPRCKLIFRSDLLAFGVVFVLICSAAMIYVFRLPRVYQSSGTLQFHPDVPAHAVSSGPRTNWVDVLSMTQSQVLFQNIAKQLTDVERSMFLKPFDRALPDGDNVLIERLIRETRRIFFDAETLTLTIQYRHPDRLMAARIANLLVDDVIRSWVRERMEGSLSAVEELKRRGKYQEQQIRALSEEMETSRRASSKNEENPFEPDAHYGVLQQRREQAQQLLDVIIRRMREISMGGMETLPWRISERAEVADEDDYLLAPIVMRMAWGFALAVVGGLFSVIAMRLYRRLT